MDCLGFRGIWGRGRNKDNPDDLIRFMEEAMNQAENLAIRRAAEQLLPGKLAIHTAFVSDTVVVSVCANDTSKLNDVARGYCVLLASIACLEVIKAFLLSRTPLLLRGCITYGQHAVRKSFFLGPAVDEAASLSEAAQGAFVWLTPNTSRLYSSYISVCNDLQFAHVSILSPRKKLEEVEKIVSALSSFNDEEVNRRFWEKWQRISVENREQLAEPVLRALTGQPEGALLLVDYPVPLKTGGFLSARVLNPLCAIPMSMHQQAIGTADSTFDTPQLDVMVKKQHTHRMLVAGSTLATNMALQTQERIQTLEQEVKSRGIGPL